ncbi:hypothetical protein EXN66_Car008362 [Channa argus]|uniref:Uncharacterized protein n=1 Tax=Channa argus TaxID=215402 RepID=A0A6G1PRR1_CHAAH|nr:hypothetical protein EXN66_Car008362 [Channa argus]
MEQRPSPNISNTKVNRQRTHSNTFITQAVAMCTTEGRSTLRVDQSREQLDDTD